MPITHSTKDNDLEINLETEVVKFINVLKTLPDTRDNRGIGAPSYLMKYLGLLSPNIHSHTERIG